MVALVATVVICNNTAVELTSNMKYTFQADSNVITPNIQLPPYFVKKATDY